MREIKYTNRFKRDYKRENAARYGKKLDAVLMKTVNLLAAERSQSPTRSARVRGCLNAMTQADRRSKQASLIFSFRVDSVGPHDDCATAGRACP